MRISGYHTTPQIKLTFKTDCVRPGLRMRFLATLDAILLFLDHALVQIHSVFYIHNILEIKKLFFTKNIQEFLLPLL